MGPARARRSVEARRASFFVHAKAICESKEVGGGTRIWAFAHVLDGARIGEDCNIGEQVFVESGATIGNRVTVKNQVQVWEGVEIGDDVFVGPGVTFANDRFPRSPRMAGVPAVAERYKNKACWLAQTRVLRGATLGAGAVVCPGVVIGEYAVVGAGGPGTVRLRSAPPRLR